MNEYPYINHPTGDTEGESDVVSLTGDWLMEWEKEQNDKIAILRRQIQTKRDYIFAESMYGRPEHRKELQAMVNAYEVCLSLVKEALK